jgi:transcriptional regulator with XRE-family HTH domain
MPPFGEFLIIFLFSLFPFGDFCYNVFKTISNTARIISPFGYTSQPQKETKMKKFLNRVNLLKGEDSIREFAIKIGIPPQTVHHYLNERRKFSLEFLMAICLNCEVSADWLLGYSNDRKGSAAPTKGLAQAKEIEELKALLKEKEYIIQGLKMALKAVGRKA